MVANSASLLLCWAPTGFLLERRKFVVPDLSQQPGHWFDRRGVKSVTGSQKPAVWGVGEKHGRKTLLATLGELWKSPCCSMSSHLSLGCWAEGAEWRSCFWSQAQVTPKKSPQLWAHTMGSHVESGHSCTSGWVIPSLAENTELLKWVRDNGYCRCPLLLNKEVD